MAGRTVSTRYIPATLTVPTATASTSPATATVALGSVILVEAELLIPTGHAGLTGVGIAYAQTNIVPWGAGSQWIIGDGIDLRFDIGIEVGGLVTIQGYNDDVFDHSFYWRFKVADLPDRAATVLSPLAVIASR